MRDTSDIVSGGGVEYRLIGEVSLLVDGQMHSVAGRRQRELLALLLLEGGVELSTERIAHELWGDALPKTARKSVQRFIADLRARLGPYAHRLRTGTTGYRLAFERSQCDLFRVEDLIGAARTAAAADQLESAAGAFRAVQQSQRAAPLVGVGAVEFAERARHLIDQLWRTAREDHFEVELALGRHVEMLTEIASFTAANPYRERGWEFYLIALYRCGRQQEALRTFEQVRTALRDDLGVSPSPSLDSIQRQILNHDPVLQAPALVRPQQQSEVSPQRSGQQGVPQYLLRASEMPLVGRRPEFDVINDVLLAALGGQAQTIVIRGEPGIGKTRLAAATAEQAVAKGFAVAYGRSDENVSIPYQVWIEALTKVATLLPPPALMHLYDRFGDVLQPLVHNLAYVKAPAGRQAAVDSELLLGSRETASTGEDQMALFQAALGLIVAAIYEGPLLLVLDDLQWADPSTLQLLEHVLQRAGGQLVIMLTHRSTGVEPDSALIELSSRLSPLPSVNEIDLGGLHVQDLKQVIENLGGTADDEMLAQAVLDQTNGNPFFATEMVRHLITPGSLAQSMPDGRVPAGAHRIIQRRVAKLGEAAAAALHVASVFGRDFELDLLAAVLNQDEFSVLDQIEIALADGLLRDSDKGHDRFEFTHDLVHQSLYDDLSSSRRARLHIAVVDTIETLRPNSRATRSGEIASHLIAAGDPRIALRACLAARDAGEAAAASLAPDEAVRWFSQAVEQLELAGDDASLRARLLVQLGINQQYSRAQNHRETLIKAATLANTAGDTDTLVEACLANSRGTFANVWNVDREAVTLLTQALEMIDDSELSSRASLLAGLASEEWDLDHQTVIARHKESITLARASGQPAVLADALLRFARARGCYFSVDDHRATNSEVSTLFEQHKIWAPVTLLNLHQSRLQVALQSADAEALRQVFAESRALRDRVDLPYIENGMLLLDVIEIGLTGDAEEYEAAATRLLEFNLGRGDDEAFVIYEAHVLYSRLMQGRTSELIGEIERIIAERPEAELYQSVAALLHVEAGDIARGAALLKAAHVHGFAEGTNVFVVQSLGFWGEVAAAVGDRAAAQVLYDMLVPFEGQFLGNMSQLTQPVDLTLGRLCTTVGRFEDAARFLASSAATAAQFNAPWMTARTDVYLGVLAVAQGLPETAKQFAGQAVEVGTKMGYRAIVRDAKAVLAQISR